MLTDYEREVANTLVEALCEYGLTENLAQDGECSTKNWFDERMLDTFGFGVAGGASKVCIWHGDLYGWVIKVGYTEKVSIDYATREYEVYCAAKEEGLECYFPKTEFLGTFNGRAFYVQEYADCDENQVTSEWYEYVSDRFEELGEDYDDDAVWYEIDWLDDLGKARLCFHDEKLCNFLMDNQVGDLHEGNFGYIGGRMVIVDFSGWRE